MDNDILFRPITELAPLIRSQKLSPVELTELSLSRLASIGSRLGSVAQLMRESAMKEAHAAETEIRKGKYRGALHGIPYGAKDLLATTNAKTTWGATPFKDQQFDYEATVVTKLHNAGAILVAKLSMIELAGGMGYNQADASLTGACRTPWNTEYWSGGSSSGPGAATAAGLLSFSIGSETSGSIITPAAYCGVSGLRPTYGAVSRHGAMALCWTLDKLGPLCHSVEDCDLVFSVIAGYDAADPTSRMRPRLATSRDGSQRNRRKKLAVMKDSYEKAQPEVRDNFLRSVTALKEFADVEMDVGLPDFPYGASVGTIVGAEGAAAFREQIETGQMRSLASPEGRVGGYTASLITAVDYLHAMRLRGPMRRAWAEMFRKFDLLIAPSRSTVAYPINQTFDQAYPDIRGAASPIAACNLVGVPAVSVPNGLGPNNLPTGIQFVGPAWGEEVIFEVVGNYQKRTDWHKAKPAVA